MAVAGGTQALIATFAFGLVALASSGIAVLFTYGSRHLQRNVLFANGLRLVLLLFLLSSALWSIMGFSATLISGDATAACQVLITFAAGFDQLARIAFEQLLLWRIKPKELSSGIFVLQAMIFVRFIIGGVLIGVQRPQVDPVCMAKNILVPLGIATLVTDAFIAALVFSLIWFSGDSTSSTQKISKTSVRIVSFLTAGFAAWLATSIPMLLGMEMFPIATRTVVPAIGLLFLLGLIVLFRNKILVSESDSIPGSKPRKIDKSKALPSRPIESQDSMTSPEVFNRPWGGQRMHVAQLSRSSNDPLPMPKPGSRGAGSALPIINRPSPGQTQRGVGGVPVQGQLFPPMRANTAPIVLQRPPKRPFKGGKPSISKPVIRESSGRKIMDKIPTVDLATAAKNDQERRAMVATENYQSQSLQRALSNPQKALQRKQVASTKAVPPISAERSFLAPDAATTAAQVSPGAEELRRRSPRSHFSTYSQSPSSAMPNSQVSPAPTDAAPSPLTRSPKRPSAPTSQGMDALAPPLPEQHPLRGSRAGKTVLRDNSGVFIDPNTPPAIPTPLRQDSTSWPSSSAADSPLVPRVQPLPMPFPNPQSTTVPGNSYQSQESVLSRNTPGSVRRDIRPSRQRPNSNEQEIAPVKTAVQLRAVNGIPFNPRAQLAKDLSTQNGDRGQTVMFINKADAKETGKVDLTGEPVSRQIFALALANSSPSTESIVHRPRPIPRKSSIYKADYTVKVSPTVYRHRLSRLGGSLELLRESIDSESDTFSRIPSFPEPPRSASAIFARGNYQEFSQDDVEIPAVGNGESPSAQTSVVADTAPVNPAGIDPETALSESAEFGGRSSLEPELDENTRRQSSPVLPANEIGDLPTAKPVPRFSDDKTLVSLPSSAGSIASSTSQLSGEGKEIVPLVLDTESEGHFSAGNSKRSSAVLPSGWHRRVGDVCPTFSDRQNGVYSLRRVLAPPPLLLGKSTRLSRIVETQPAPPVDSPQHALDMIQQQLRRLDEADSETGVEDMQHRTLLENIEAEMGAQESHWQDIRRNLAAQSPSSTRSSASLVPSGDLNLTSPRPSPAPRSHDLSPAVMGKDAAPASGPENYTITLADEKSATPPSRLSRGRSKSVFTDDGSVQATVGGVENRAQSGKSASRNSDGLLSAISNSIPAHRQLAKHLGSPTPPDTDESEDDVDQDEGFTPATAQKINLGAWNQPASIHPASVEPTPLPVSHWSIDSDTTTRASETLLQAQDVSRFSKSPLRDGPSISTEPEDATELTASAEADFETQSPASLRHESLFSPQPEPKQRPQTQRPPRRSKRITLLPDIPESPKPLKNKRDTLGVFQFPWGETSDIATLQPHRNTIFAVPLPGATLNDIPPAQPFLPSQGPVLPSQVYPASFFDHYDDDSSDAPAPDSDGSTGGYSDEEDEAFDETTLWEIANLLRSSEIPSRDSLFPGSEEYRPPSRAGFVSADETPVFAVRNLPTTELEEESTLGPKNELLSSPLPTFWKSKTMFATVKRGAGLPQPDQKTWQRYLGEQSETLRAAPRMSEPDRISSTSLWTPPAKKAKIEAEPSAKGLWQPSKKVSTTPASSILSTPSLVSPTSPAESCSSVLTASTTAESVKSHGLWSPPAPVVRVFLGLPQDEKEWSRYSSGKIQSSRPKPRSSVQDVIQSTSLWQSATIVVPVTKPVAQVAAPAPVAPSPLWTKPAALPAEQTDGLWSPSHIRREYKKTDKRPAALDTVRKLRIDYRPLATLHSASLWSTTTQMPPRQVPDWLALSTTLRPVSPSAASTISDQDYASAFDTYSLRSEVTAASSVATSKQSQHRKTASKQAAQEELDAAFRDVMQTRSVPEAVVEEPEHEEEKLFFDVTKGHPVFAVDVLQITSDSVHPAATGYLHSVINGAPKPRRK